MGVQRKCGNYHCKCGSGANGCELQLKTAALNHQNEKKEEKEEATSRKERQAIVLTATSEGRKLLSGCEMRLGEAEGLAGR